MTTAKDLDLELEVEDLRRRLSIAEATIARIAKEERELLLEVEGLRLRLSNAEHGEIQFKRAEELYRKAEKLLADGRPKERQP